MNVRFKCRGMTVNGEWVYGYLSIIEKEQNADVEPGYYISNAAGKPFAFEVRPETVGQCTGLIDKNYNLIYAGDIICYDDTPYSAYASKVIGTVVSRKGGFYIDVKTNFEFEKGLQSLSSFLRHDNFFERKTKIIGNIHDDQFREVTKKVEE